MGSAFYFGKVCLQQEVNRKAVLAGGHVLMGAYHHLAVNHMLAPLGSFQGLTKQSCDTWLGFMGSRQAEEAHG